MNIKTYDILCKQLCASETTYRGTKRKVVYTKSGNDKEAKRQALIDFNKDRLEQQSKEEVITPYKQIKWSLTMHEKYVKQEQKDGKRN